MILSYEKWISPKGPSGPGPWRSLLSVTDPALLVLLAQTSETDLLKLVLASSPLSKAVLIILLGPGKIDGRQPESKQMAT